MDCRRGDIQGDVGERGGTDRRTNIDSEERERDDYARAKGWQRDRNLDEKELVGVWGGRGRGGVCHGMSDRNSNERVSGSFFCGMFVLCVCVRACVCVCARACACVCV